MTAATPYGGSRNALRFMIDQRLRAGDPEDIRKVAFMGLEEIRGRLGAGMPEATMVRRMCRDWLIDRWAFEDAAYER